jgi:hypothetical protein
VLVHPLAAFHPCICELCGGATAVAAALISYDDLGGCCYKPTRSRRSWSTTSSTLTRDYVGSLLQLFFRYSTCLVVTTINDLFTCTAVAAALISYDDLGGCCCKPTSRRRSWLTTSSTLTRDYVGSLLQLFFCYSACLVVTTINSLFTCKFPVCDGRYSTSITYPLPCRNSTWVFWLSILSNNAAIAHGGWSQLSILSNNAAIARGMISI